MNNRDTPSSAVFNDKGWYAQEGKVVGLTKLEYAAIAAMQGLLAEGFNILDTPEVAVDVANALFDELDKEK